MGKSIAIIGTLDTKGDEIRYLKDLIEDRGHKVVVIDGGVIGSPMFEPTFKLLHHQVNYKIR